MLSHTGNRRFLAVAGYVYRSRGVRCTVRPLPGAIAWAVDDALRQQQMQRVNPAIVLRNWLAQRAIDAARTGRHGGTASVA